MELALNDIVKTRNHLRKEIENEKAKVEALKERIQELNKHIARTEEKEQGYTTIIERMSEIEIQHSIR